MHATCVQHVVRRRYETIEFITRGQLENRITNTKLWVSIANSLVIPPVKYMLMRKLPAYSYEIYSPRLCSREAWAIIKVIQTLSSEADWV